MTMTKDTINSFWVAPTGYTRNLYRVTSHGCDTHPEYRILCPNCGWKTTPVPVSLVVDIIALILDRDTGEVLEYVTADDYGPDVVHLAHDGAVVIREDMLDNPTAEALMYEARLYADCFSVRLSEVFPSEVPA